MRVYAQKYSISGYASILMSVLVCCCSMPLTSCQLQQSGPSQPPDTEDLSLTIWWEKGFNVEEDEAIQSLVATWEQQSGQRIELLLLPSDSLVQKTQRALVAGKLPNILFASKGDYELYPQLAAAGRLADVSELIVPNAAQYDPNILEAIQFQQGQRYYAVPFAQYTLYIHYWKHLVNTAQSVSPKIPKDWQGFWNYWKQAQDQLRVTGHPDIYGIGLTLSKTSGDTYLFFEQLLEAYDVELVDASGQLRVSDPDVKAGIENCLRWSTGLLQAGYVPPDAKRWLNPDNNRQLLNQAVVMTPNSTLSIPKAVSYDPKLYQERLGTMEFPDKPSGRPMRYIKSIKKAVIFADTPAQEAAKAFLGYMVQPKVMARFLQQAGGRYLPVSNELLQMPYWRQTRDPHLAIATQIITQRPTRLHYSLRHPAYANVHEQKVWGQALHRILHDQWSVTAAANEAITSIQQIFQDWQDNGQTNAPHRYLLGKPSPVPPSIHFASRVASAKSQQNICSLLLFAPHSFASKSQTCLP